MNTTTNSENTEADALNAPSSLTPAQATAQKLVEQWEAKGVHLIRVSDYCSTARRKIQAKQIEQCRRELQAAFGLDSEKPA